MFSSEVNTSKITAGSWPVLPHGLRPLGLGLLLISP